MRWILVVLLCSCGSTAAEPASALHAEAEAEAEPEAEPEAEAEAEAEVEAVGDEEVDIDRWEAERRAAIERFTELLRRIDPEWLAALDCNEYETDCSVKEHAGFQVASHWSSGSGVDAGHYGETRVYRDGELVVAALTGSTDGAYVSTLDLRPATPGALEAWARATDTRWTSESDPARSRAELFLSANRNPRVTAQGGFVVRGPLYRSSSSLDEECETFQDDLALPSVHLVTDRGLEDVWFFQWDEPVDRSARERFIRVAPLRCPEELEQSVGEHRVRVYELYGRNSGVAIAVRGRDGRYRWALETRNAVLGSEVSWIGALRGWLFGYTRSRHPGYIYADTGALFAIRARDGAAVTIDVPPVFERGLVNLGLDDDASVADDCASEYLERNGMNPDQASGEAWQEALDGCEQDLEIQLEPSRIRISRPDGEQVEISTRHLFTVLNRL